MKEAEQQLKFTQAALAYLIYGMVYEGFAVFRVWEGGLPPDVASTTAAAYLIVGALLMVIIPYFIYRGCRRLTQLIALLVGLRAIALVSILGGFHLPFFYEREPFFLEKMSPDAVYAAALAITLVTLFLLVRAGWDLRRAG